MSPLLQRPLDRFRRYLTIASVSIPYPANIPAQAPPLIGIKAAGRSPAYRAVGDRLMDWLAFNVDPGRVLSVVILAQGLPRSAAHGKE
jgi:hypothetical protein